MARSIQLNKKSPRIVIKQVGTKGEQGIQGPIGPVGPPGSVDTIVGQNNIVVDSTDLANPIVSTDFKLHIGETPPQNPSVNDLWIDTRM